MHQPAGPSFSDSDIAAFVSRRQAQLQRRTINSKPKPRPKAKQPLKPRGGASRRRPSSSNSHRPEWSSANATRAPADPHPPLRPPPPPPPPPLPEQPSSPTFAASPEDFCFNSEGKLVPRPRRKPARTPNDEARDLGVVWMQDLSKFSPPPPPPPPPPQASRARQENRTATRTTRAAARLGGPASAASASSTRTPTRRPPSSGRQQQQQQRQGPVTSHRAMRRSMDRHEWTADRAGRAAGGGGGGGGGSTGAAAPPVPALRWSPTTAATFGTSALAAAAAAAGGDPGGVPRIDTGVERGGNGHSYGGGSGSNHRPPQSPTQAAAANAALRRRALLDDEDQGGRHRMVDYEVARALAFEEAAGSIDGGAYSLLGAEAEVVGGGTTAASALGHQYHRRRRPRREPGAQARSSGSSSSSRIPRDINTTGHPCSSPTQVMARRMQEELWLDEETEHGDQLWLARPGQEQQHREQQEHEDRSNHRAGSSGSPTSSYGRQEEDGVDIVVLDTVGAAGASGGGSGAAAESAQRALEAAVAAAAAAPPPAVEERFVPGDFSYENLLRLDHNRNRRGEGLALAELRRFRTVSFHTKSGCGGGGADNSGSGLPECSICLEAFEEGMPALQLPCKHSFHGECIGKWVMEHHCCPVCRHDLRRSSGRA